MDEFASSYFKWKSTTSGWQRHGLCFIYATTLLREWNQESILNRQPVIPRKLKLPVKIPEQMTEYIK